MPKDTFFRLPDEKKKRIMEAAVREFLSRPYADTSINKIIKDAEIPRGSFYQYFEDKKDLFLYVIGEQVKVIVSMFEKELKQCNGDIFTCVDRYIDEFVEASNINTNLIKAAFSETWVFEMLWNESIGNCSHRKNKITGKLIDNIDRDMLDVENEEELNFLLGIMGATIKDTLDKVFLSGNNIHREELKRVFHGRILSLKKHYSR